MDSVIDVFISRKIAANEQMNRNPTVLRNAMDQCCKQRVTKYKLHSRYLMLKFSKFSYWRAGKFLLLFIRFCTKFCPIAAASPLRILGFKFHTLWLQFQFHRRFPLLSYDLNTVSLNECSSKKSVLKNLTILREEHLEFE